MVLINSRVKASMHQVSSELSGETIMLSLKSGAYFGLDGVGARIWSLLQQPIEASEIEEVIIKEYDVEPERCERDLLALLQELEKEELIDVEDRTST